MQMNPVLAREMRSRMRTWRSMGAILLHLGLLAAIVGGQVMLTWNQSALTNQPAQIGSGLFTVLVVVQGALLTFNISSSSASVVNGERQRQTLDLLLVTALSPTAIILGKLAAALAFDLLILVCSAPLFALVFLFGGVNPPQMLDIYLLYLATMLALGAVGVLLSTLLARPQVATIIANVAAFMLTFGLLGVSGFLYSLSFRTGGVPTQVSAPFTVYLDPAMGVAQIFTQGQGATSTFGNTLSSLSGLPVALWQWNALSMLVLAIVATALAIAVLRRRRG